MKRVKREKKRKKAKRVRKDSEADLTNFKLYVNWGNLAKRLDTEVIKFKINQLKLALKNGQR